MLVLYYLRAQKTTWTDKWSLYAIWRSLIQTIQRSVRNKYSLSLDHSHKDRVYADVGQPPLFSIFELWSLGQRPTHTKPCYKKKKKIICHFSYPKPSNKGIFSYNFIKMEYPYFFLMFNLTFFIFLFHIYDLR